MEESVQCGECGNRFDSNENAFCPRCGSVPRVRDLAPEVATQAAAASRSLRDPSLRRVRTAGIVLMVLGGLAAAQFLYLAIVPPEPDAATLEAFAEVPFVANEPGGDLRLHVVGGPDGAGGPNGTGNETLVVVRAMNDTVLFQDATVDGWFNATLPVAFANLTVGGQTHKVYVSEDASLRLDVDLDVAQEDASEGEWHAASTVPFVRPMLGFLAFMALVVTAGGFAAWRVQALPLAVTGAVLAIFPGLLVLMVSALSGLLLLAPGAMALAFILGGRKHFLRR